MTDNKKQITKKQIAEIEKKALRSLQTRRKTVDPELINSIQFLGYSDAIEKHLLNINAELHTQEHRLWDIEEELSVSTEKVHLTSEEKLNRLLRIIDDVAREIHMIREGLGSTAYEIKSEWKNHPPYRKTLNKNF